MYYMNYYGKNCFITCHFLRQSAIVKYISNVNWEIICRHPPHLQAILSV